MDRVVLALVAGVLGGAAGAFTVDLVRGRGEPASVESSQGPSGAAWKDIADRLGRIERALPPATVPGAGLEGRPAVPSGVPLDAAEEARLQRIEERVAAAAERAFAKAEQQRTESSEPARPRKKRVTLAEAATELGLSRVEESELRRIYDETNERVLKLLAEPDGDVEAVRRDLEASKSAPGGREAAFAKYLPKVFPKIGELLAIEADRQGRIATVLGPERAERFGNLDVSEGDLLGFGGNVRVEAENR